MDNVLVLLAKLITSLLVLYRLRRMRQRLDAAESTLRVLTTTPVAPSLKVQ